MNKYAIGDLIQIFSIKLLGFSILTNSLLLIISTFSERNFTGSLLEDFNCSWICFGIFFSKIIKRQPPTQKSSFIILGFCLDIDTKRLVYDCHMLI